MAIPPKVAGFLLRYPSPEWLRRTVMLSTQRSLATAQLGRNSFEEIFESRTPLREAALESFRRRNAVLDGIFYDIAR
jgi:hypothetical protein